MAKFHVMDFIEAARQMVGPSLSIRKAIEHRRIAATIQRTPHQGKRERERRLKRKGLEAKS